MLNHTTYRVSAPHGGSFSGVVDTELKASGIARLFRKLGEFGVSSVDLGCPFVTDGEEIAAVGRGEGGEVLVLGGQDWLPHRHDFFDVEELLVRQRLEVGIGGVGHKGADGRKFIHLALSFQRGCFTRGRILRL
jgi:hypothetical protein